MCPFNRCCLQAERNFRHTRLNVFRSYHVHQLISARVLRCLRFISFVIAGNARLAAQRSGYSFLRRDLHPQDQCSFAQRTVHSIKAGRVVSNSIVTHCFFLFLILLSSFTSIRVAGHEFWFKLLSIRLPDTPVQWLTGNGSAYTAHETRKFARDLNLAPEL